MTTDQNSSSFWLMPKKAPSTASGKVLAVVSSVQPTSEAADLLRVCLDSLRHQINVSLEIFVVDVGSPISDFRVRPSEFPDVNFFYISKAPEPWMSSHYAPVSPWLRLLNRLLNRKANLGSYLNGWGLQVGVSLASHLFKKNPEFTLTLQMDTMFCDRRTIEKMLAKMKKDVTAVGLRAQKSLDGKHQILHSLGCLWRTTSLLENGVSLLPRFPSFDVGEEAIVEAIGLGQQIVQFECSYSNPSVEGQLKSPEIRKLKVDRTVGDENELLFMHLGRGVPKSSLGSGQSSTLELWSATWSAIKAGSIDI